VRSDLIIISTVPDGKPLQIVRLLSGCGDIAELRS
jgi:hypothetical protein